MSLCRRHLNGTINKTELVLGTKRDTNGAAPSCIVVPIERFGSDDHAWMVRMVNEKKTGRVGLVSILGFFILTH